MIIFIVKILVTLAFTIASVVIESQDGECARYPSLAVIDRKKTFLTNAAMWYVPLSIGEASFEQTPAFNGVFVFMAYFILFGYFIPISLFVNLGAYPACWLSFASAATALN